MISKPFPEIDREGESDPVRWALAAPVRNCTAKLMLVALASAAGPDGTCRASVGDLAKIVSADRRAVQRGLSRLIAEGWLERRRVMGFSSVFRALQSREASTGCTFVVERQSDRMHDNSNSANIAA